MTDYALLYVGPDGKAEWSPLPWFGDGPPRVRALDARGRAGEPHDPQSTLFLYIPLRKPRA